MKSFDPSLAVALITLIGGLLGGWMLYLASGSRDLRARIESLESRMTTLEAEKNRLSTLVSAAASFINRVGQWISCGQSGPMPTPPPQLHDHIDTELWRDDLDDPDAPPRHLL